MSCNFLYKEFVYPFYLISFLSNKLGINKIQYLFLFSSIWAAPPKLTTDNLSRDIVVEGAVLRSSEKKMLTGTSFKFSES